MSRNACGSFLIGCSEAYLEGRSYDKYFRLDEASNSSSTNKSYINEEGEEPEEEEEAAAKKKKTVGMA